MTDQHDDMLPEYDFSTMRGGERGKYFDRYQAGTNLIQLDSDVQAFFPDSESVNFALRHLAQVMQHQQHSS